MRMLITGGAGFIGSNFIRHILRTHPGDTLFNLDKPTYAGNLESLADIEHNPNYHFIQGDITSTADVAAAFVHGIDVVVHFAAESHVDRSILDPAAFVQTNVVGTQVLLDAARTHGVRKFVHVSTDEVYGALGPSGYFTEQTPLEPNSPYSASKAASDLLVRATHHTYGLPVNITRCSNNYGPYQFPEKLIPLTILRALAGEAIPVYGDGQQVRDWLHVVDHCRAIDCVVRDGVPGEVYNIGSNNEWTNLNIVKRILDVLGKSHDLIQFVTDRLGHDRRYAIDSSKIGADLGWLPEVDFGDGLAATVQWYVDNAAWWQRVQSGAYQAYFATQYGERFKS